MVGSSLAVGYALGARSASSSTKQETSFIKKDTGIQPQDEDSSSEMEEEDLADGDLSAVKPGFFEPCKMVRCF